MIPGILSTRRVATGASALSLDPPFVQPTTTDVEMRDARPDRKIVRRVRSNSRNRFKKPLSIVERHSSNTKFDRSKVQDVSLVAVFSREGFENFGRKWKELMDQVTPKMATNSSRKGFTEQEISPSLSLQNRTRPDSKFENQMRALMEGKSIPHVIAVIEGKKEQSDFSLRPKVDDKILDVLYTQKRYEQGTNNAGSLDNKQSTIIYVRKDVEDVYSFTSETIRRGHDSIKAVAINYATEDGTEYQSLVVHIPNKFIGTKAKETVTHEAFQTYAKNMKGKKVVTGYLGDTNYSSPVTKYSSPSMGGHLSDGSTLNPQSSGAKVETHFMQSVPLSDDHDKHCVLQPSTLNYVFLTPDDDNPESTDHPSFMHYTLHDSLLKGRQNGELSPLDFE